MKKLITSVSVFTVLCLIVLSGCSGSKDVQKVASKTGVTDQVSKSLGLTKSQTEAGLGAMMMLSKDKLSEDDFSKLTKDLPGGSDLIKKAEGLGVIPGSESSAADIVKVLGKLGVSPADAAKFVPAVLGAVKGVGGSAFGLMSKVF